MTSINTSFQEPIPESVVVHGLLTNSFDMHWRPYFEVLFTEISSQELLKFAREHAITTQQMERFYKTHIKPNITNKDFEEACKL